MLLYRRRLQLAVCRRRDAANENFHYTLSAYTNICCCVDLLYPRGCMYAFFGLCLWKPGGGGAINVAEKICRVGFRVYVFVCGTCDLRNTLDVWMQISHLYSQFVLNRYYNTIRDEYWMLSPTLCLCWGRADRLIVRIGWIIIVRNAENSQEKVSARRRQREIWSFCGKAQQPSSCLMRLYVVCSQFSAHITPPARGRRRCGAPEIVWWCFLPIQCWAFYIYSNVRYSVLDK